MRVIWGDRDAFLETGLAEASAALCDQAEVFHLPHATHWVQHEEPDAVNRLLTEPGLSARIGNSARQLSEARYAWSGAARALESFFRQVLQDGVQARN